MNIETDYEEPGWCGLTWKQYYEEEKEREKKEREKEEKVSK